MWMASPLPMSKNASHKSQPNRAMPLEGFDKPGLDELLKLKEKGLKSQVLLTLGYRDEANDYLANLKKVRRDKDKLFVTTGKDLL